MASEQSRRVDDVMKEPQGCREGESVAGCAKLMETENIGFVPICDRSDKPVGTLTDRDLAIRVLARSRSAETTVDDVMSRDVVSCALGDSIEDAERLMREHHKSRIMVCDQDGKLAGVISLSDIADLEEEATAGRTLREVSSRETQQPHAS